MLKRSLPVSLIVGALIVVAAHQGRGADAPNRSQADVKEQLLSLEREWTAAEDKHDAATLRRILDDKFIAVGTIKTYDKEAFIKLETSGEPDPTQSQTSTYESVIVDGDTAVVVGTDTGHGTKNGAAYTVVFKYTVTYIYRGGHWVALAEQLARVPPTN